LDPVTRDRSLKAAHQKFLAGEFDACVELARGLRLGLQSEPLKEDDRPALEALGWAFFYEIKGLYERARHAELAEALQAWNRSAGLMSYKNESWLYSAGAETARVLGKVDEVVLYGRMAADVARQAEDWDRSFRAASAAALLLKDMGSEDRNDEFALYLLEQGAKVHDASALADGVTHLMTNVRKSQRKELVRYLVGHSDILGLAMQVAPTGWAASVEEWLLREDVLGALEGKARSGVETPLRLVRAAFDGDLASCQKWVAASDSPHAADIVAGRTPLMAAALGGQTDILEWLLDQGADVNARNPQGRTALVMAADHGHARMVSCLLRRGANVLIGDSRGVTALHAAAVGGFGEIVSILVGAGMDVDHPDEFGNTALHRASAAGHRAVVELLLGLGSDIDARGSRRVTPLIAAAQEGRFEVVRWLVEHGADSDLKDENAMTALDWAAHLQSRDEKNDATLARVVEFLRTET
jgi:ankyrin repeat protein